MIELRTSNIIYDAENTLFRDTTGNTATYAYGQNGNITQGDIEAVRLVIGNYSRLNSLTDLNAGDTFVQFTQYMKTVGSSSTINGKSFVVGDIFVPQVANLVVPSGDTWQTTGYYVPQILATWLPTTTEIPLNLNVTELGGAVNTKFTTTLKPQPLQR